MLKITVNGVPGYDGDYEFRIEDLVHKDLHLIKQVAGIRAGELNEALAAGDNDLIIAFTQIAIERSGKRISSDILWNAKLGSIEVMDVPEEGDEVVPPPSKPEETSGTNGTGTPSGVDTPSLLDPPASDQNLIGVPGSESVAG